MKGYSYKWGPLGEHYYCRGTLSGTMSCIITIRALWESPITNGSTLGEQYYYFSMEALLLIWILGGALCLLEAQCVNTVTSGDTLGEHYKY